MTKINQKEWDDFSSLGELSKFNDLQKYKKESQELHDILYMVIQSIIMMYIPLSSGNIYKNLRDGSLDSDQLQEWFIKYVGGFRK